MKTKEGFIHLILLLLIFGAVLISYVLIRSKTNNVNQPSPSATIHTDSTPTANPVIQTSKPISTISWKTYKGNGFSFKYPDTGGWAIYDNVSDSTPRKSDILIWVAQPESEEVLFSVYGYKTPLNYQEWWTQNKKTRFPYLSETFAESPGTVDNKQAIIGDGNVGGEEILEPSHISIVNSQGWVYMLIVRKDFDSERNGLGTQIFSTFKF